MKKIIFFVFGLFMILPLFAQEIRLEKASELTNDLTARTKVVLDLNDDPCALVRIQIPTEEEVSFEGNIIQVEKTPGEFLIYVPEGTKRIRVKHPQCAPFLIDFSEKGLTIKGKTTYAVLLVLPASVSMPEPIKGFNQVWVEDVVFKKEIKQVNGKPVTLTVKRFFQINYDAVESSKSQGFCTMMVKTDLKWGEESAGPGVCQWIGSWKYNNGEVLFTRSMKPQFFGVPTEYVNMAGNRPQFVSLLTEKEAEETNNYIKKVCCIDVQSFTWKDVEIKDNTLFFVQDGNLCSLNLSDFDAMTAY